jgi:hypothetical protein
MSTTLVAALLAGFGLLAVLGVSYAFYLVGRAEDRDRATTAAPPEREPEPERIEWPATAAGRSLRAARSARGPNPVSLGSPRRGLGRHR